MNEGITSSRTSSVFRLSSSEDILLCCDRMKEVQVRQWRTMNDSRNDNNDNSTQNKEGNNNQKNYGRSRNETH